MAASVPPQAPTDETVAPAPPAAAATTAAERFEVLDALRGFALAGILLANVLYWSGWVLMTEDQRIALAGESAVAWQYRFHHLLVDGKFYTLFSLLFGLGFALQLARLERRGVEGVRVYRRRALVLLGIGAVHCHLIWDGDILMLYALLGLALPAFRGLSDRALLACAVLLIWIVPFAGSAAFAVLGWAPHAVLFAAADDVARALGADPAPEQVVRWLQREDFVGWLAWVASGPLYSWGLRLEAWRIPKVLGIMLIGLVAGRHLANGTLLEDRRRLKLVLAAGLAIGLPANFVHALTPGLGQSGWASTLGTVPLALAYAAAFVLAWPRARGVLQVFVAPGRMALTNYLAHSLMGIALFYGVGLGLTGRLEPPAFYAIAVGIYAAQAWASRAWLARHELGPAERAWRRLTYRGVRPAPAGSS